MGGGGGGTTPRNLYQETAGELKAKADLAPKVFSTEAQYRPQYNALDMQQIMNLLNGTEAGTREEQYSEWVAPKGAPYIMQRNGINMPPTHVINPAYRPGHYADRTRTINTPAMPGLMELSRTLSLEQAHDQADALHVQRASDLADVENLGPMAMRAVHAADPGTSQLIDTMTDQASNELNLGSRLDPSQMRQVQQTLRARRQGMLGGTGSAGDFAEALGVSEFGNSLRQQRRQFATGAIGLRQGVYGDAFNRVLGRPAAMDPSAMIGQATGLSRMAGPTMFGSTINANDVADSNFNAANAKRISDANNSASMTSAGISAGAGIASAAILAALV